MATFHYKLVGDGALLLNNPRTVDPFDEYSIAKKKITGKRSKTEEDQLLLRKLDVESKLYFDDALKIYVPTSWVSAALAANSWSQIKIKKSEVRASVIAVESRLKLYYRDMDLVKTVEDISGNPDFVEKMLLKQAQVKICKCLPIFHEWEFEGSLNFDNKIIDEASIRQLMEYAATYGGFGDFRPTYGRAKFIQLKEAPERIRKGK